jgi:hypothetical protein
MAGSKIQFNYKNINKIVSRTIEVKTKAVAKELIQEHVDKNLKVLEKEILADDLSKELLQGTKPATSKYITSSDKNRKYGNNLFSFLGFEDGSNPVAELIALLKNKNNIKVDNGRFEFRPFISKYTFKIRVPSEKDIKSVTPLHWGKGKSWISAVEKGLTNAVNYLRKMGEGRSKGGVQMKNETSKEFLNKSDYFFEKYKRFISSLSKRGK